MSYYNNNNRGGIYGNQNNNIYGLQGQNMYQNQNFNRSQGNYQNNYNPGGNYNQNNNYQQQNYNNQNQQNNGPIPFISGKMGRILISSETLETFSKSLRSAEWTNNSSYMQAKNIEVKMKSSSQNQSQNNINIPKNRFNEYRLNSNFNFNNFTNFLKEVKESNQKIKEKVQNEKNNFMRNNFPNERDDLSMNNLYVKIGQNRKDVVMKDSSLYRKVERLLPLLKAVEVPKNLDEDNKKPSNDNNMGAPSGPLSNDDKKIFTNDGNVTPGFL